MSGKSSTAKRRPSADPFHPLGEHAARLAWLAPAAAGPSPRVREALLARVRAARAAETKGPPVAAGWKMGTLATDAGWLTLPFPGVRMREVTLDAERDTALVYVEMAPGAAFPDHTHSATERGLILTGDLTTGGRLLGAGDFYEAAPGTRHERVASPSGCTGLLWLGAQAWQEWRKLAAV